VFSLVAVNFHAITLTGQWRNGRGQLVVTSAVRFAFEHGDGWIDSDAVAYMSHTFGHRLRGALEIKLPPPYRDPSYQRVLEGAIESYYRRRVGPDGDLVRFGQEEVGEELIGTPFIAPERSELVVDSSPPSCLGGTLKI
jgi:hypothetical protein